MLVFQALGKNKTYVTRKPERVNTKKTEAPQKPPFILPPICMWENSFFSFLLPNYLALKTVLNKHCISPPCQQKECTVKLITHELSSYLTSSF